MQKQIVSEVLGIPLEKIDTVEADTDTCLWHLGDYASRGTYVVGMAAKKVAESMKKELQKEASELLEIDPDLIELYDDRAWDSTQEGRSVSISEVMLHCQKDNMRELCCAETHPAPRAVQDVGRAINPMALEGQLAGAIHMGLGYGLLENITYDAKGRPKETGFKSYQLLNASDMPKLYLDFVAEGRRAGRPLWSKEPWRMSGGTSSPGSCKCDL